MTAQPDFNFDLLKRLCESPGIPGREDAIRAVVREELASLVDEISVDALGYVIGVKRGNGGPRVMLAGHIDEIGFLVRHIDERGFLRLHPVGGFDARNLVAQRVIVHGFGGLQLCGALAVVSKPAHLLDPGDIKPPKIEDLFVDLGMSAEQVHASVEIGDMVTLDRTCERVGQTVLSKSLDDRVGVFVMLEALRTLNGPLQAEIVAVATTQEEVGLRGAETAAYQVDPTIAVALDTTPSRDVPGTPDEEAVSRLGAGVTIKVMDSWSISNHKLVRHLRQLAATHHIPHQPEILPRGGTDAGAMQRTRAGVPAVTLSIPARYGHTVNEMCAVSDIQAAIALLAVYLRHAHEGEYTFA
jgi:putative aminopeptidase FrvX